MHTVKLHSSPAVDWSGSDSPCDVSIVSQCQKLRETVCQLVMSVYLDVTARGGIGVHDDGIEGLAYVEVAYCTVQAHDSGTSHRRQVEDLGEG